MPFIMLSNGLTSILLIYYFPKGF